MTYLLLRGCIRWPTFCEDFGLPPTFNLRQWLHQKSLTDASFLGGHPELIRVVMDSAMHTGQVGGELGASAFLGDAQNKVDMPGPASGQVEEVNIFPLLRICVAHQTQSGACKGQKNCGHLHVCRDHVLALCKQLPQAQSEAVASAQGQECSQSQIAIASNGQGVLPGEALYSPQVTSPSEEGSICPFGRNHNLKNKLFSHLYEAGPLMMGVTGRCHLIMRSHPQCCARYNEGMCADADCKKLHICSRYILGACSTECNTESNRECNTVCSTSASDATSSSPGCSTPAACRNQCGLSHSLQTPRALRILDRYGMLDLAEPNVDPIQIKWLIRPALFKPPKLSKTKKAAMEAILPVSGFEFGAGPLAGTAPTSATTVTPVVPSSGTLASGAKCALSNAVQHLHLKDEPASANTPLPLIAKGFARSRIGASGLQLPANTAAVLPVPQLQHGVPGAHGALIGKATLPPQATPVVQPPQGAQIRIQGEPPRATEAGTLAPSGGVDQSEKSAAPEEAARPSSKKNLYKMSAEYLKKNKPPPPPGTPSAHAAQPNSTGKCTGDASSDPVKKTTSTPELAALMGMPSEASAIASESTKQPFLCERHLRGVCPHEQTPARCALHHIDTEVPVPAPATIPSSALYPTGTGVGVHLAVRLAPIEYLWQYRVPEQNLLGATFEHCVRAAREESLSDDGWLTFFWDDSEAIEKAFADPKVFSWPKTFDFSYAYPTHPPPNPTVAEKYCILKMNLSSLPI